MSDNFFDDSVPAKIVWKENLGSLGNDLSMYLKFSLEPGQLFVKKNVIENPSYEAFKEEVKKDVVVQNQKLEELTTNQQEIKYTLETILSILQNRNP
jgi:hypothetical protein